MYRGWAPANIALLKYWGLRSKAEQKKWAASPSLSMTLAASRSCCDVEECDAGQQCVWVDGVADAPVAQQRMKQHILKLQEHVGVKRYLRVRGRNTFPADCGLASSAAGFAALTVAVMGCLLKARSLKELEERGYPASRLAALALPGSGSAARSFWGGYVSWLPGTSTPQHQVLQQERGPGFFDLADTILVVSSAPKPVSSSEGHGRCHTSPLYAPRLARAEERWRMMVAALGSKDFALLGHLSEVDAAEMHSIAMTGEPPIHYWHAVTQQVLVWVCEHRARGTFQAYATVDAGANVHVLSLPEDQELITTLAHQELPLENIILDGTGGGPVLERL